jgi:outer membrane protein TolC
MPLVGGAPRWILCVVTLMIPAHAGRADQSAPPQLRIRARDVLGAPSRIPSAPLLLSSSLSLEDALRLTLAHDPVLQQGREALRRAEGSLQEARGLFDTIVSIGPGGSYVREPLDPSIRNLEVSRRQRLSAVAQVFGEMESRVRTQLASTTPRPPFCPNLFDVETGGPGAARTRRIPPRDDGFRFDPRLDPSGRFAIFSGIISTPFGDVRLSDLCQVPGEGGAPPSLFAELWRRLRTASGYPLDAVIDGASRLPIELLGGMAELSETFGIRGALGLERLGDVPEVDVRKGLFLEGRLDQPLRSGIRVGATMRISSEQLGFAGKPRDPAFGGRFVPVRFPSFVEAHGEVPLGSGRGSVSAARAERAAELSAQAARESLRHQVTEELFRTVVAYVALAVAEARVALLEASIARGDALAALGEELVKVGEIAAIERARVAGRLATLRDAQTQAATAVITARRSLVEAMGVRVDSFANGPHATTPLPSSSDAMPPVDALLAEARTSRRDPLAARRLRDAAAALSAAAAADLRRSVTLNVRAGMSTFYESPFFRFLPDEQQPIGVPGESQTPVGVTSVRGFGRIFTGAWKPYVAATLTFDLPLANRSATGRAQQASASLARSEVVARDLDRTIAAEVVRVSATVRAAAEVLERRGQTLSLLQRSFDGTVQQLRMGEATMVDVLLTEEELTSEDLQRLSDLQVYATALARLRFETGTLARYQLVGLDAEALVIRPLN